MNRCDYCDVTIVRRYVLIDRYGVIAGEYCSRACADDDAVGPRFEDYRVDPR